MSILIAAPDRLARRTHPPLRVFMDHVNFHQAVGASRSAVQARILHYVTAIIADSVHVSPIEDSAVLAESAQCAYRLGLPSDLVVVRCGHLAKDLTDVCDSVIPRVEERLPQIDFRNRVCAVLIRPRGIPKSQQTQEAAWTLSLARDHELPASFLGKPDTATGATHYILIASEASRRAVRRVVERVLAHREWKWDDTCLVIVTVRTELNAELARRERMVYVRSVAKMRLFPWERTSICQTLEEALCFENPYEFLKGCAGPIACRFVQRLAGDWGRAVDVCLAMREEAKPFRCAALAFFEAGDPEGVVDARRNAADFVGVSRRLAGIATGQAKAPTFWHALSGAFPFQLAFDLDRLGEWRSYKKWHTAASALMELAGPHRLDLPQLHSSYKRLLARPLIVR